MANEHEGDDVSPSVKKERKEKEEGEGWEEEEGAKEVPEFAKRCEEWDGQKYEKWDKRARILRFEKSLGGFFVSM